MGFCASLTTTAYADTNPQIEVNQFELVQFKPQQALGWTKETVTQFLDEQFKNEKNLFSMQELELLARQLSIQMKQAGLMFSRAQVPEQEIKNKTVQIVFEDGLLGEVVVMDAKRTKPKLLVRPFLPFLQTTAVRSDLDQALYQLDRLPGLDVFGFFSVTDTPGLSRLNLRVVDEFSWSAFAHTDNHGSESVGRERFYATLDLLNFTGWGDQLKLNVGRSYSQPGFFDGYAQYTLPVGPGYNPLRFLISNSDFNLGQGFASLEVFGQSTLASVQYEHNLSPYVKGWSTSIGGSLSESKIDSVFYSDLFFRDSSVAVLSAGLHYSNVLTDNMSHHWRNSVRFGNVDETSVDEDGTPVQKTSDFTFLSMAYRVQYFQDKSANPKLSSLNFELFGANNQMPSVEQQGFGGFNGIRGLPTGYFSADQGALVHLSHDIGYWPDAFSGRLSVYADGGWGHRLDRRDEPAQTAQFASVGVGYGFAWHKIQFRYDFGKVVHVNLSSDGAPQDSLDGFNSNKPSRHYFSLSYDLGQFK